MAAVLRLHTLTPLSRSPAAEPVVVPVATRMFPAARRVLRARTETGRDDARPTGGSAVDGDDAGLLLRRARGAAGRLRFDLDLDLGDDGGAIDFAIVEGCPESELLRGERGARARALVQGPAAGPYAVGSDVSFLLTTAADEPAPSSCG